MFEIATPTLTLAQATGAPSASPPAIVFWIAAVLVLAGLGIIAAVILSGIRGRRAEDAAHPQESAAAAAPRPSQQRSATPSTQEAQNLLRLMGEAEELCTRLGRDLDDKAQRLERLLARAEGRLGSNPPAAPEPPRVTVVPVTPGSPYYQPTAQTAPARPEIVTRPVAVPSAVGAAAAGSPQQTRPTPAPLGLDPLSVEIYRLSDAGAAPSAIAQQLGQHTGKVELILALRSR